MKKSILAAALVAGGLYGVQGLTHAHGGQYRGPGDTVPPGGGGGGGGGGAGPAAGPAGPTTPGPAGPVTPGAGAPGAPGGGPSGRAATGGGGDGGPDLTQWSFWWEFNKEPFLNLKSKIQTGGQETGTDGFFLGHGENKSKGKDSLKPTEEQVRQRIVPALLDALAKETNNDIVTGAMIALAKIGDASTETGESKFEGVIAKFLSDSNQEISESAAVALGILANPKSIDTLAELLGDTEAGRKLVGQPEVNYRTRAFATYGLGLIGARTSSEEDRKRIVGILRETLESDNTRTRDLKVSCVISMGLVRLETIESTVESEKDKLIPAENSRTAQLEYLLAFLQNEDQHYLVRAHCPTALARLLVNMPPEQHQVFRERIANDLLERAGKKKNEQAEIVQSAVLALGLIGTNDGGDPLDKKIRETLAAVPKDVSDQQARNFSLIALAKMGGTTPSAGGKDVEGGIDEITKALLAQLADGKTQTKAWAGLACGVMANTLAKAQVNSSKIPTLQAAVRTALEDAGDPSRLGAYAVSSGIMGDIEAKTILMKHLDTEKDETARGYVAIGLGLMNARDAIDKINKIVDESKYRPDLLKQAAIALGLLGDKDLVPKLTKLLEESKGLATQASLSSALGFIGDQRSIEPLVAMLQNDSLTERARGFAAVALGIVADKEPLPWNSKIGLDLNYRASTQTLTDQSAGTGILDIL